MVNVVLFVIAGLLLWNLFFRAIPQLKRMKAETKRMEEQLATMRAGHRNK